MPRPEQPDAPEVAAPVRRCLRCANPLPAAEHGWNRQGLCPSCRALALQEIALTDFDDLPEVD